MLEGTPHDKHTDHWSLGCLAYEVCDFVIHIDSSLVGFDVKRKFPIYLEPFNLMTTMCIP